MQGCVKDDPNSNFIKLSAEGFTPNNSAKVAVSDEFTYWRGGDLVWINGSESRVHVSGSNEAEIRQITENPDHEYRGVYPASVFKSVAGSYNFTVKVPSKHYYKEDSDGKQIIDELPMVAYFSGEEDPEVLEFKHVTAAITVRVKNTRTDPKDTLELDRIELINTQYRLGGEVSVDIRNAASGGSLTVSPQSIGARDSVVVIFNRDVKSVAPDQIADIQIPIIPVGDANSMFTIRVSGHIQGARYIFEKSTSARNNSILRACLGYATTKFEQESVARDLFDVKTEQTITVGGEPVTKNFYEINTADELITLAEALDAGWNTVSNDEKNYRTGNYILMEDIDLKGAAMVPIHYYNQGGAERVYFYGNGRKISNFTVTSSAEIQSNCCGLFGRTSGSNISVLDLTVENGTYILNHKGEKLITGDANPTSAVGGIFSYVDSAGIVIENCTVRNVQMGSSNKIDPNGQSQVDFYVGGIVGLATKGCTIRNCRVENVTIDNTNDVSDKLVDQFGGALGRVDATGETFTIENFVYDQGSTAMEFSTGLNNIRYGGLIANVTRGGLFYLTNITLKHNVVFLGEPSTAMFAAGLLGSNKASTSNLKFHVSGTFKIQGQIDNRALSSYSNDSKKGKEINKYFSVSGTLPGKIDGTLEKCPDGDFTLTVISTNGKKTGFNKTNQTLFKN